MHAGRTAAKGKAPLDPAHDRPHRRLSRFIQKPWEKPHKRRAGTGQHVAHRTTTTGRVPPQKSFFRKSHQAQLVGARGEAKLSGKYLDNLGSPSIIHDPGRAQMAGKGLTVVAIADHVVAAIGLQIDHHTLKLPAAAAQRDFTHATT